MNDKSITSEFKKYSPSKLFFDPWSSIAAPLINKYCFLHIKNVIRIYVFFYFILTLLSFTFGWQASLRWYTISSFEMTIIWHNMTTVWLAMSKTDLAISSVVPNFLNYFCYVYSSAKLVYVYKTNWSETILKPFHL